MSYKIQCDTYSVYIDQQDALNLEIEAINPSSIFVLVDENTEQHCLFYLYEIMKRPFEIVRIFAGEVNKNIYTCSDIWDELLAKKADRKSLMINLGGGVIGDMGGFVASTYMRGIRFIQMPTTLLSQVDASVGGKLGVDHKGIKNMVGVFQNPEAVIINTQFLKTLPYKELLSGFAELLKHGLIADESVWNRLSVVEDLTTCDFSKEVYESVSIKRNVVVEDPREAGLRKILNFGHTVGHAVETLSFQTFPLLHGEAIAIGMITEAFLSMKLGFLSQEEYLEIKRRIKNLFGNKYKSMPSYQDALSIMAFDKKNSNGHIQFSLLERVGKANSDQKIEAELIFEAFEDYKN